MMESFSAVHEGIRDHGRRIAGRRRPPVAGTGAMYDDFLDAASERGTTGFDQNMKGTRNPFGRRPHPCSRIHLKIWPDSPKNRRQKKSWQSVSEGSGRRE